MNALQQRLNCYKARAAERLAAALKHYPNAHPGYLADASDWKQNRYPKPAWLKTSTIRRGLPGCGIIYAGSFDDLPLIQIGGAHDINRRLPLGWYTDEFQDDTLKGFVLAYRNPHKLNEDGNHLFYIAATFHSDWDGVTVYADQIHDTQEDAARYADECARIEAEECWEADEIYQREQRQAEAREELHAQNKATLELIREVKQATLSPAICAAVRQVIRAYLADRTELLQTIKGA